MLCAFVFVATYTTLFSTCFYILLVFINMLIIGVFWKEAEKEVIGLGFQHTNEVIINKEPHVVSVAVGRHVLGLRNGRNYIIVEICRHAHMFAQPAARSMQSA